MKKWIVRAAIVLAVLVAVTAVGLWLVVRQTGQPGGSVLERWITPQVLGIAEAYLLPQLSFEDLDFQLPLTVVLSDVRLRAQDPSRPGQIVDLLAVRRMELRLAEMPRTDRPIVISALILEQPVLTLVPDASGEGRFVGLSDLVKKTPTVAAMPQKDGEPAGLGDVFSVRLIELRDAQVVYDPRAPGVEPMRLDQISTKLEVDSQAEGSGWYTVHSTLARDQVFEVQIDGRLSINSLVLEIDALRLDAELRQDQSLPVPPKLQQLLREHEVAGTLAVTAHGRIDGSRWRDSSVTTEASLTAAHMSVADYRLSIRSLILQAGMADGALNFEQLRIELDHGSIHSRRGQFRLGESPDAELELEARGLWIQDFLATPEPLQRAKFAGRLDADLKLTAPLTAQGSGMVGGGWLKITEGRLLALPVLNELVAATEAVGRLLRSEEPSPTDRLSAEFQLAGDRLTLTTVAVDSPLIALRGQGDIFLDARLDLRFRGGPLDKVGGLLGPVGELMGAITDQLGRYEVTGTIEQARVTFQPGPW